MRHRWFRAVLSAIAIVGQFAAAAACDAFAEQLQIVSRDQISLADPWNSDVPLMSSRPHFMVVSHELPPDLTDADNNEICSIAADTATRGVCSEESWPEPAPPGDECEIPLVRFRKSFLQGTHFSLGSVSDDPDFGVHIRTIDANATFAVPVGGPENIVSFTPYIRADLLEAAAVFDVPESLFETGLKTFWKYPVSDRLGTLVLFAPSVRSDFTTSESAFRIFGMGLLTWQWIPQELSISGGVVYTGREDFPVLPGMGLLWTPAPEWKFDIQFPSPRISRRLKKNGGTSETWGYVAGVFGGNTWAVTRPSGGIDELTIRDLRLVTGLEHIQAGNQGFFLELGYVFNRSLEYTSTAVEQNLDSAVMMRAGITF